MEGKRQRPDDPDAGIVDDKMAEARERAARIENDAGAQPDKAQDAAIDTEDRQNEREAADVQNLKVPGNGDDAIENGSLSGRPMADKDD